jgi:Ca2+/Na+ antiporter
MVAARRTSKPGPRAPSGIVLGGLAFRTLFIIGLAVLTARVAMPQIEKLWTVFETPDDLIRVALGFALCVWCVVNLFVLPKDAEAYRTWLYLGLAVLPLSLLCTFLVW